MKTLIGLIFFLGCFCKIASAQEKTLEGIVFDKDTKVRLNRVNIYNSRSQKAVYNNIKAEFNIATKKGDLLITSLLGYKTDTVIVGNQNSIVIFLKRLAIPLAQVTVRDTVLSAQAKYEATKKEFNRMYRLGNDDDILTIGPAGVGLSIDAIWSTFSREGKNARRLMEVMQRDFQNQVIDQRFNERIVRRETGLAGDNLYRFLLNYRPSYFFAVKASEYELLSYIKTAYKRFKSNPYYDDFSLLKPIPLGK